MLPKKAKKDWRKAIHEIMEDIAVPPGDEPPSHAEISEFAERLFGEMQTGWTEHYPDVITSEIAGLIRRGGDVSVQAKPDEPDGDSLEDNMPANPCRILWEISCYAPEYRWAIVTEAIKEMPLTYQRNLVKWLQRRLGSNNMEGRV